MAAIAMPDILDQKIIARLRTQASQGIDLETMVRSVQDELGFSHEYIVPVFAYFCKAFSLPLLDVLPLREWLETKDDNLIQALFVGISECSNRA